MKYSAGMLDLLEALTLPEQPVLFLKLTIQPHICKERLKDAVSQCIAFLPELALRYDKKHNCWRKQKDDTFSMIQEVEDFDFSSWDIEHHAQLCIQIIHKEQQDLVCIGYSHILCDGDGATQILRLLTLLSPGDCLLSKLPNPRIPSDHKAEKNKNQKKKNNSCRTSFCSPSPAYQRAASKHSTKAVTANLSICLYSERCSAMCLCPDTAQHLRSECRDNSLSGKSSFLSAEKAKLVHCKFRWRFSGNTAWSGSSRLAGAACGCPSTNAGGKGTLF